MDLIVCEAICDAVVAGSDRIGGPLKASVSQCDVPVTLRAVFS